MRLIVWAAVLSLLVGGTTGAAQEKKAGSSGGSKSASKSGPSKEPMKDQDKGQGEEKGKLRGTLPQNYGKVGLTDEQRQEIYRIQARYNEQLDKLEKQLDELKIQRNSEYQKVLTKAQKAKLDELKGGGRGKDDMDKK